jgi:hypothetical protein
MIKAYVIAIILFAIVPMSHGSDWLGGGYVKSGDTGNVKQYFTDPIFTTNSGHFLSSDPSIREMQISLDMPRPSATAGLTKPAVPLKFGSVPGATIPDASGIWQIDLADGTSINLNLHQSGKMIFGSGTMAQRGSAQGVAASGELSGKKLLLNVVPNSGTELHAFSLDTGRLPNAVSYTLYRVGASPVIGSIKSIQQTPLH